MHMTHPAGSPIHEVFAYLRVRDAAAAIAFYEQAFGARERFRLVEPSGRIGHAELHLGPAVLMLSDAFPEYGLDSPGPGAQTFSLVHLHVDDADAMARRAVDAGADMLMEPADQFYGERSCRLRDPFGHTWLIGHSIEDVAPEEMQRRYTALMTAA
jgi:PhnB protein